MTPSFFPVYRFLHLFLLAGLISLAASASLTQVPSVQFAGIVPYSSGGYRASSIAIGDVNGDGKPDVVVASGTGASVLLGNGDGNLSRRGQLRFGWIQPFRY